MKFISQILFAAFLAGASATGTDSVRGLEKGPNNEADPLCYEISCHYSEHHETYTLDKISFHKCREGPDCKDWSYVACSRDEKVEDPEGTFAVPGSGATTFEVKAGLTCFDVSCDHHSGASVSPKDECEFSGKKDY